MNYDVIIIGGGVSGLSTAMQLAMRGARVVVLERQQLGSGSTGRAAGNLGQLRGTAAQTRFQMDAVCIIRELEDHTGSELFIQSGSIRLAETEEGVVLYVRCRPIRCLSPLLFCVQLTRRVTPRWKKRF